MSDDPVRVTLNLAVEGEHLNAVIAFSNDSGDPIYLEAAKTLQIGGTLEYNLFHIYDEEERLPFSGKLVKRQAPSLGEFIQIQPAQTITATIRLDSWYTFPFGEREYQIFYQAVNSSIEQQPLLKLVSNRAFTRYRRLS